jgi:hypothetical protein
VFGNLTQIVADASGWAYAIVFLLALGASLFPTASGSRAALTFSARGVESPRYDEPAVLTPRFRGLGFPAGSTPSP